VSAGIPPEFTQTMICLQCDANTDDGTTCDECGLPLIPEWDADFLFDWPLAWLSEDDCEMITLPYDDWRGLVALRAAHHLWEVMVAQ